MEHMGFGRRYFWNFCFKHCRQANLYIKDMAMLGNKKKFQSTPVLLDGSEIRGENPVEVGS